jgi:hypothetical protein
MAVSPNFEIPQQLRDLAEKNLEQARAGYGQFMDAMTQAMGMWAQGAPAHPMTAGFKVLQGRANKFAKQNAEAYFNLAGEIANAKDLTDVGDTSPPCADFDATYTLQAQELGRLMMEASQSLGQK